MSTSFAVDAELLPQWQRLLAHPTPSMTELHNLFRVAVRHKSPHWVKRVAALACNLADEETRDFGATLWGAACEMGTLSRRVVAALLDILDASSLPSGLQLVVECVSPRPPGPEVSSLSQSQLRRAALVAIRKRRSRLLKHCLKRLKSLLAAEDLQGLVADIGTDLDLLEKLLVFTYPYSELYSGLARAAVALLARQQPWPLCSRYLHIPNAYRHYTLLGPIMDILVLEGKAAALSEAVKQGLPDRLVRRLLRNLPDPERSTINVGALMATCSLAGRAPLALRLPADLGPAHFNTTQAAYEALLALYQQDSLGTQLVLLLGALGERSSGLSTETLTQVAVLVVSLVADRQQALEMLNTWRHTLDKLHKKLRWRLVLQVALRCPAFVEGGLPELVQALLDTLIKVGSWRWRRLREVEGQAGAYGVAVDLVQEKLTKRTEA